MLSVADVLKERLLHVSASFDATDPKFVAAMNSLQLHEQRKLYPVFRDLTDSANTIEPIKNNRTKFLVNLKLCLIMLMHDRVNHETWTNNPLPKTAEKKKPKKRPPTKKTGRKRVPGKRISKKP